MSNQFKSGFKVKEILVFVIETLQSEAKVKIDVKNSNIEKTMFNNWNNIKGVLLNFGLKLTENIIW